LRRHLDEQFNESLKRVGQKASASQLVGSRPLRRRERGDEFAVLLRFVKEDREAPAVVESIRHPLNQRTCL